MGDDKIDPTNSLQIKAAAAAPFIDMIAGFPIPIATAIVGLACSLPSGRAFKLNERVDELATQAFQREVPTLLSEMKVEAIRSIGAFADEEYIDILAKAVVASAKEGANHPWLPFHKQQFWITLRSITGQQFRLLSLLRTNTPEAGNGPWRDSLEWMTEWLKRVHGDLSKITRDETSAVIQALENLSLLGGPSALKMDEMAPSRSDVQLSSYGREFVDFVKSWDTEEAPFPGQSGS